MKRAAAIMVERQKYECAAETVKRSGLDEYARLEGAGQDVKEAAVQP